MFRLLKKRIRHEIVNGDVIDVLMIMLVLLGIVFVICGAVVLIASMFCEVLI